MSLNHAASLDGLSQLVHRHEIVDQNRAIWLRVLGWCGLASIAEGLVLSAMLWLLFDALRAQFSLPYSSVYEDGPVTLFGLAAMGSGWINARLVSHVWGVGWSAAIPLSAQTVVAVGVGWFVGTLLMVPFSSDCIETLVMVGIVMAGTSGLTLRFEG